MNLTLDKMPRWAIVALVSRTARHLQQAITLENDEACRIVNDTLGLIENVAGQGRPEAEALRDAAVQSRRMSQNLTEAKRPQAAWAAQCAARAAEIAALEGQPLIKAAIDFLNCVHKSLDAKGEFLANDLQEVARFSAPMRAESPAPVQMLNFVRQQAIHEAGHALAAYLVGLPFLKVSIVYDPQVEPIDHSAGAPDHELRKFQLCYAGGAAADILFGATRNWATERDRDEHRDCGGTDFDADVRKVQQLAHFDKPTILAIVTLLESSNPIWKPVNDSSITDTLNTLGVQDKWPWTK